MIRTLRGTDPKAATPSKPKILIFGKPGVGKTWASLDFPSVYYIDTEGGANLAHYTDKLKASGGMYLGPENGANDFGVVLEEIVTLATTAHNFRTLVIDSFSKLFSSQVAMTADAMEKAGKKNEFGADKKPSVGYSRRMIHWFDKLDMNVILICHEKPVWKNGEQAGVTFDGWEKLEYELHLAMNIYREGAGRKAKVSKTRLQQFKDADCIDWSYESFADRYGREAMEGAVKVTELASAEQIARYRELLGSVKVDAKVMETWDQNCDRIEDLDVVSMQKRLDFLTSKLPK